nr:fimbrial protein [Pectobacterium carotovorum]
MLLFLLIPKAQAVTCETTSDMGFNLMVDIPLIGSAISTIGEDVPVGGEIYSINYIIPTNPTIHYSCDSDADLRINYKNEAISMPSGGPVNSGQDSIYPTNIPGIGVKFAIRGANFNPSQFPFNSTIEFSATEHSILVLRPMQIVVFKFIKTGPIEQTAARQILASSLPTFQISLDSQSPYVDYRVVGTIRFSGEIAIHTKTCQLATSDIRVNLGNHEVNSFDGAGKATEWKGFDIVLKGCPPFYGYGNYRTNPSSGIVSGSNIDNAVALTFRSVNGVVDNNPKLAKIDSGVNAATGVGIELSRGDIDDSISLDGSKGFNMPNLLQEDNANYTIPLKARYVQTDATVKPGPANGSVTFTITYQ